MAKHCNTEPGTSRYSALLFSFAFVFVLPSSYWGKIKSLSSTTIYSILSDYISLVESYIYIKNKVLCKCSFKFSTHQMELIIQSKYKLCFNFIKSLGPWTRLPQTSWTRLPQWAKTFQGYRGLRMSESTVYPWDHHSC